MTHDPRCPSCGHVNEIESAECSQCHFPLRELDAPAAAAPPAPAPEKRPEAPAAAAEKPVEISMQRIRPVRPRRPTGREQTLQLQLWLILGSLAIAIVLWTAWQGFQKNNAAQPPVEGASTDQQHEADVARAAVAQDSTNINAQIALANVLYDTANWPEAIIHYKSALRLDPTRATVVVDLGVCYFNLSDAASAEQLWKRALTLDPNLVQVMYNLGFLNENKGDYDTSLKYYHQAMRSNPGPIAPQLSEAIQRVMQKMGKTAPPLSPGAGSMPGGMPGGTPPPNK